MPEVTQPVDIQMTMDIHNHYWVVANNATDVYSSAAARYVLNTDQPFLDHVALGFLPSHIANEVELFALLSERFIDGLPTSNTHRQCVAIEAHINATIGISDFGYIHYQEVPFWMNNERFGTEACAVHAWVTACLLIEFDINAQVISFSTVTAALAALPAFTVTPAPLPIVLN